MSEWKGFLFRLSSGGGGSSFKRSKTGAEICKVPDSGWFRSDYSAGVLLVTEEDELCITGDISEELAEDVGLAAKLSRELHDLLGCVDLGLYRARRNMPLSKVIEPWGAAVELDGDEPAGLDFAFVVAHGDSANGDVGGMSADETADLLARLGVGEAVLLVCGGGCPNIGEVVSNERTVVACGGAVDARAAFVFGVNYVWKRFGEGASPAQALGASNVVLPSDPYQIWNRGERI